MRIIKVLALIVLGAITLLSLVVGIAAPFYEANFNERRERFQREGIPVTETVLAKVVGRKGKHVVCGPEGAPLPAAGEHPEGRWVRVSPATFDEYHIGDRIELLVIGEEYFVRDARFYTILQPTEAYILVALGVFSFVLVKKVWKPGGGYEP
jgi:hypothetical protein